MQSTAAVLAITHDCTPRSNQGGAPIVDLLRARLAHRALQLLVDDEDDLFYDTGRYHTALLEGLVGTYL